MSHPLSEIVEEEYASLPFICSNCGMKYKTYMESDTDISICKWCAGDEGYENDI